MIIYFIIVVIYLFINYTMYLNNFYYINILLFLHNFKMLYIFFGYNFNNLQAIYSLLFVLGFNVE